MEQGIYKAINPQSHFCGFWFCYEVTLYLSSFLGNINYIQYHTR